MTEDTESSTWTLKQWMYECFHGIRRTTEIPVAVMIANVHRELSEAWEEYTGQREEHQAQDQPPTWIYHTNPINGDPPNKPEGFVVELADVVIWIFHYCWKYGLPLEEALRQKMAYNARRPQRNTKGT